MITGPSRKTSFVLSLSAARAVCAAYYYSCVASASVVSELQSTSTALGGRSLNFAARLKSFVSLRALALTCGWKAGDCFDLPVCPRFPFEPTARFSDFRCVSILLATSMCISPHF